MKHKSKLNARERRALSSIGHVPLYLDFWRRFRNAFAIVVAKDTGWIAWVEQQLPKRIDDFDMGHLQIVEQRAREIVLSGYRHLHIMQNEKLIFDDNGVMVQA